MYFLPSLDFVIAAQQPPEDGLKTRVDLIVSQLRGKTLTRILFVENKRYSSDVSAKDWAKAAKQLLEYIKSSSEGMHRDQTEEDLKILPLYAAVNIGHFSRFYRYNHAEGNLTNYPTLKSGKFHLIKNSDNVHKILTKMANEFGDPERSNPSHRDSHERS